MLRDLLPLASGHAAAKFFEPFKKLLVLMREEARHLQDVGTTLGARYAAKAPDTSTSDERTLKKRRPKKADNMTTSVQFLNCTAVPGREAAFAKNVSLVASLERLEEDSAFTWRSHKSSAMTPADGAAMV